MIKYFKNMSRKSKIIIIIGIIISLFVRYSYFSYQSGDYNSFLVHWVNYMRNNGGIYALRNTFSDYNLPYLTFLSLLSYIKVEPLYFIKIFSLIFDYLLAFLGCCFVIKYKKNYKNIDVILCFLLLIFSPTMFLNSSWWGQCDSIYTFFALLSIYFLGDDKVVPAFISFGVAISFKLQAIFILPVFIITFFCKKNVKLWHFLLIPLVNQIMCLPAIAAGADFFHTYKIYFLQVGEYSSSVMNSLNVYNYLTSSHMTNVIGFLFTGFLFFLLLVFTFIKRRNITSSSILILTLLSIVICYFFLPCMHERYLYMGDVLSIILLFTVNLKFFVPILINIVSLITYYIIYKLTYNPSTYKWGPVLMMIVIFFVLMKFITNVCDNEALKKCKFIN